MLCPKPLWDVNIHVYNTQHNTISVLKQNCIRVGQIDIKTV